MEKIFKILVVFALLMLIIAYSLRTKERRYQDYFFSRRIWPPLPIPEGRELLFADVTGEADTLLLDQESSLLYVYKTEGTLTIFRVLSDRSYKEMQQLSVPRDCTSLSIDVLKDELYLYAGEEIFVFSK